MFTDTHCHIFNEYYDDINEVLTESNINGIYRFIVAGTNTVENKEILNNFKDTKNVYLALGIHPEEANNYSKKDISFIESNINNNKVIAIGEIGLDYHYEGYNKEKQIELLETELKLAQNYNLPVVVHVRDAVQDTIDTLKKYPKVKGVIHAFSGSIEVANIYIKMGYKLGINGVVTFKNSKLINIIPDIKDSIVFETDSPYLTPHPYRGTKNSPKYIKEIIEFIEEKTGISKEELSKISENNIKEIFNI